MSDDIEQRIGKAQERITNSIAIIGEFLAGKAADAAENAAKQIETVTKAITGTDPTTTTAKPKAKATASKTTAKPRTKGGEAVN